MDLDELHYWTLSDLAVALGKREISPVEVTQAQLERIDALDDQLHAYVTVTAQRALERAKEAELEIGRSGSRGPLHGVPIALKDLCATRGVRTTAGTRILRDWVPDEDACVVERLEAAGAIVLGKLQMTEGAFSSHHPDVTPPINPWDASSWTGISSSGSGVATAAGLCFASLGTDTGGSIRFPSASCGLAGIKPTYGRVSRHGVVDLSASLDHVGPMARSVADAAHVRAVIAGVDPRDPTSLRAPVPDYAAELGRDLAGLRIGIDEAYCREDADSEMADAVLETAAAFRSAGAELREVRMPDLEPAFASWGVIGAADIALAHQEYFPERADDYGPALRSFLEAAAGLSGPDYARACEQRATFKRGLENLFDEIDLLLCPAMALPMPAETATNDPLGSATGTALMRFTLPFDISGSPTLTLPCGYRGGRTPIGLQLVARHLEEALLVRAGDAFQRETDWHRRNPPL
jgi:amidase